MSIVLNKPEYGRLEWKLTAQHERALSGLSAELALRVSKELECRLEAYLRLLSVAVLSGHLAKKLEGEQPIYEELRVPLEYIPRRRMRSRFASSR